MSNKANVKTPTVKNIVDGGHTPTGAQKIIGIVDGGHKPTASYGIKSIPANQENA